VLAAFGVTPLAILAAEFALVTDKNFSVFFEMVRLAAHLGLSFLLPFTVPPYLCAGPSRCGCAVRVDARRETRRFVSTTVPTPCCNLVLLRYHQRSRFSVRLQQGLPDLQISPLWELKVQTNSCLPCLEASV
jgi:hypothetical protein